MSLRISCVQNKIFSSNTYIIDKDGLCVIVDPGTEDCEELFNFLNQNCLIPEYIILTHEHFDHVWGCNTLRDKFGSKVISSRRCAENLKKPQRYFLLLFSEDRDDSFCISKVDWTFEGDGQFMWNGLCFDFTETRGHSSGSMCFSFDNYLFSGDTLIKGYKPVIRRKDGGSLDDFKKSVERLFIKYDSRKTIVYPGHGESFMLEDIEGQYRNL